MNNYRSYKYLKKIRALLPKNIGIHRILSGPNKGYRIYTSWFDYPAAILGYTERPLLKWFATQVQPGETWLDIGAHYGYTAIALCRYVGHQGRVFAFEPMINTAGYLSRTRQINDFDQLTIIPMGLGDKQELTMLRLPVVRGMVDSTLVNKAANETFLVCSLDWLWLRINEGDERVHGIKVDVQGMELNVLSGMTEVVHAQRPKLVIELHHGVDRKELFNLLDQLGYSRQANVLEPIPGEVEPLFIDDRSYAFYPLPS